MNEPYIDEHAFKHGLNADDIEQAWGNYVAMQFRGAPNEGEVVTVGFDARGRLVQMVAVQKPYGTLIVHAMTPPTDNVLRELGIK